jgi:mannose-1-phosphate guanylyltransferase
MGPDPNGIIFEKMANHVVIMAGGIGSRFWPLSTPEFPKQFIDILGCGRSLIQLTVDRFKGICPESNFWVVTNQAYVDIVKEQIPGIPSAHILAEPAARNTAPCIAWACWSIKQEDPDANVVVTPSDAVVMNPEEFRRVISDALAFTSGHDFIVTIGIKPNRPETGYGYVETTGIVEGEIYDVKAFKEKPDHATAEQYLQAGNYLWNAGIFVWNVSTVVNAFRMYQPGIARIFEQMFDDGIFGTPKEQEVISQRYAECDNISVDYAIMEKAEEIFVCPADFGWSDLGTWGSLHTLVKKDANKNGVISRAAVRTFDTVNCIINIGGLKEVVVQGLDGFIVAERDGKLLICKLSEEQRIKEFQ